MGEQDSNESRHRNRGGIFFPLLILTAGVLLLMSNFGYLPGGFWGFVEIYWPVLLVLMGLDGLIRGNGITGSLLVAGFGGILLAGNLGYIEISAWEILTKGWPLILIAFGLDIIVGHRSAARSIIGLLLAFVLIAGLVWLADLSLPGSVKSQDFQQKYQDETSLTLNIQRLAGSVELLDGGTNAPLLDAKLNLLKNEYIEPVVEKKNGSAVINLEDTKNMFPGTSRPVQNSAWKIRVNAKPELTLRSEVVMGEARYDLRGLSVDQVESSNALGRTIIYLAENDGSRNRISGAIGQITIYVPAGAAVRINVNKAIGAVDMPERYIREDGVFVSPAYTTGAPSIDVSIELPIGAIQVVEYSTSL